MIGRGSHAGPVTSSIPAILRERARLQPDDVAFTFVDYEQDWDGVTTSLTWSHVYRRALGVAQALRVRGSIGDRAVILAPHGLEYIVAFLGALQAGLIAVPLSVPQDRSDDERVAAVLRDAAPAVILTTSSAVSSVKKYVNSQHGECVPLVVYVDWLDLDWRKNPGPGRESWQDTAYLQYASGSTGQPAEVAGVTVSHAILVANSQQVACEFCDEPGKLPSPDTTVVSWLPFDHDMGLITGICAPIVGGFRAVLMSPAAFLQRPARWMQLMARYRQVWSAAPNFGYELAARRTSDDDIAGLDLRGVLGIFDTGERIHPATLQRFARRFARCELRDTAIRPSYGLAEATAYVATRPQVRPPRVVRFDSVRLAAGLPHRAPRNGRGTALVSYGVPRSLIVRIVDPDSRIECPAGATGEIWVYGGQIADQVAMGYWNKPHETQRTFGARLVAASRGIPEGPWLRTGDLGFFSEGELFVTGRVMDRSAGRAHRSFPDDMDETLLEITRSRVASQPERCHLEAIQRRRMGPNPTTTPRAG
jgi:long-chain fatty acid adenylyltransferase FadD28